jgi:hypothetical protein
MTNEEKLEKVTKGFSLLSEEKQDYILGIIQSLAFAHDFPASSISIPHNKKEEYIFSETLPVCAGNKIKHD